MVVGWVSVSALRLTINAAHHRQRSEGGRFGPLCSRKNLVRTAKPRRQLLQAIQRRAKVKGRRPADNLLNRRPDPNQKPIPFSAFGAQGNLPPLRVGTSPRRKRLQGKATNGKSCDASFTESIRRFRIGKIVILNEEGMTIHIPADPNKRIRWRRSPRV